MSSYDTIFDLAFLEQHYSWYAHYLISRGYFLVFVDVDLDEFYLTFELVRQGFNCRCYRMARSAPVRVEIYEHRDVGFEDFSIKLAVVKVQHLTVSRFFGHHD